MKEIFNKKEFLENAEGIYSQRINIEKAAVEAVSINPQNIIFIGIGGTWGEFESIAHVIRKYTSLPVYVEEAAEFSVKRYKPYFTEKSLIITASVTGNTKEVVNAIKLCSQKGSYIVAFTPDEKTDIGKYSSKHICMPTEDVYFMTYMFVLKFLNKRSEFEDYDKWINQMEYFHEKLAVRLEKELPVLNEIAEDLYKSPYSLWIASGAMWGETHVLTNCVIGEMQWKKTNLVSSGEFFHGPMELVDEDLLVFLVKGLDEYRKLDERAENFVKQYAGKLHVFDSKNYMIEGFDNAFDEILAPMIMSEVTYLMVECLADKTGHDMEFRRYYRQFDY